MSAMNASHFTVNNIVAILRSVESSDGTYKSVVQVCNEQYGGDVGVSTLAGWVTRGKRDAGKRPETAYARFAKEYKSRVDQYCTYGTLLNRTFDEAMAVLETTCDCGEPKELLEDGTRGATCAVCRDIDGRSV